MRAYFFGNMYLSQIQQGIQAAHAVHEMFVKYRDTQMISVAETLYDWAVHHKTMILLNGGYADAIQDLVNFFNHRDNHLPFAPFYEEKASLNGALTTVGIVVPEKIYATAAAIRKDAQLREHIWENGSLELADDKVTTLRFSRWEAELIDKLNTFSLA